MTVQELWQIREEVYRELKESIQEQYHSAEESAAAFSLSIDAVETFWLKAFHQICDESLQKKSDR